MKMNVLFSIGILTYSNNLLSQVIWTLQLRHSTGLSPGFPNRASPHPNMA